MVNPLVAQEQSSTTAISGISLLEGAQDLKKAIESGDWASGALGAAAAGLDALGFVLDPFGSILAAGVGWLIEHVGPLKDALDALAGNPDAVKAHSETWKNIAAELGEIGTDLANQVNADLTGWTGPSADTYRQQAKGVGDLLAAAKEAGEGTASGIETAGTVVAAVRTLVRDIIAEVVGHMISWALQVIATLGIALAWVVPQVISEVAKTAAKIADITGKLTHALKALAELLKKAGGLFTDTAGKLKKIKTDKPPTSAGPGGLPAGPKNVDPMAGKGGGTIPNSTAKTPPPDAAKVAPPPKLNDTPGDTTKASSTPDAPPVSAPPKLDGPPPGGTPKSAPEPAPVPVSAPPKLDGGTTPSSAGGTSKSAPPKVQDPPNLGDSTTPSSAGGTTKGNPATTKEPGKKDCEFDPIDVATGDVLLTEVDLVVPGALGELITRNHVSSYRGGRWFGPSWTSLLDERLTVAAGTVRYHSADAMVLSFPVPAPGRSAGVQQGPVRLLHTDGGDYVVTDPGRGLTRRFAFAPGARDELLLREVRTEDGEFVVLDRDADGTPVLLTHSAGARIAFDTADGRVRSARALSPAGEVPVARYDYDEHGHLARRWNSTPRPALYEHDAAGRITGWTDHNGSWYRYVYDDAGRCVRTVGDRGFLDGALEFAPGRTTTTDSLGHRKTFEFDAEGNLVAETDKLGAVTRSEWGPNRLLRARTDPLGRRTEFEHDAAGILRAVVRPDGSRVVIVEHTATALEIAVTEGDRTFRRRYTDPVPDPYTTPLGVSEEDEDEAGRPPAQAGPVIEEDLFGRPRVLREPGGPVTLAWTVEGDLRAVTTADGARRQWTYDGEGGETSHTDALDRVTVTERGPFAIVTGTVDATGARTLRHYDTELRLTAVTNPAGQTWTFTYDAEGRLTGQTDFDGRTTQCSYDAAGQLVRLVNAAGEVVDYRYDALGNLTERTAGGVTETYRHDPVGRLVHLAGPGAEITLERDDEGRVVRQTTAGRTTTFGYPDAFSTNRRTPSEVDVHWGRSESGVDTVTVGGTTLTLHRDENGRTVAANAGATPVVRRDFDARGRLLAQQTPAGTWRYRRRPDGSIETREDPSGGARYEFDRLGRVTAVHTPGHTERYAYDVLGNVVLSQPGGGAEAGPRQYRGGLVEAAGAVRYDHDAQGRLVRRMAPGPAGELTWSFTWDAHDHLTGVRTPDGAVWHYLYDPMDRRVAKQRLQPDGTVAERVEFVWDGNTLVEALHTVRGALVSVLTWVHHPDDGRPVAQAVTGPDGITRLSVLVTDDVGTPVEAVDLGDGTVRPLRTTLWGLTRSGDGDATPLRFPGQYHDAETGLHFNVFRYYDPATGRFVSPDPLGLNPAPNPLAYVADPLMQSDPLGLTGGGFDAGDFRRFSGRSTAGKCSTQKTPAPSFTPYPKTKPKKGSTSGSTSSAGPSTPAPPRGTRDPVSGRFTSQGGGTTSGLQVLDGSPRPGGSKPQPGELTDVIDLNKTKHSNYSKELQDELSKVNGYNPNGDNRWIRGHLQNDNLGGPGISSNMTPLTSTANKNMSGTFEGPLKNANIRLDQLKSQIPTDAQLGRAGFDPSQFDKVRKDIQNLTVEYRVDVSPDVKFPDSSNPFERSIRQYLVLNAEYKGLTPEVQQYIGFAKEKNFLPKLPPPGTKMDTLTGAFS
ncbi:RHS repeat-associated core domain-containing protein [Amycolatopsis methanolica]|uniref:Rhs protein n=1 Tax=Amycolatopsis methanolica 239 TaxID=1068978 RepID=A0A076MU02_AMYME|nr:RHS repeat-associated core domain-containing protein [Amycolatopsis methanolica]AIJ22386.1 rhs protein [Amycolatopsis methanolica 239]